VQTINLRCRNSLALADPARAAAMALQGGVSGQQMCCAGAALADARGTVSADAIPESVGNGKGRMNLKRQDPSLAGSLLRAPRASLYTLKVIE